MPPQQRYLHLCILMQLIKTNVNLSSLNPGIVPPSHHRQWVAVRLKSSTKHRIPWEEKYFLCAMDKTCCSIAILDDFWSSMARNLDSAASAPGNAFTSHWQSPGKPGGIKVKHGLYVDAHLHDTHHQGISFICQLMPRCKYHTLYGPRHCLRRYLAA